MSRFPVRRIGSTLWEDFGADGFNEYGYNEQGFNRQGTPCVVIRGDAPWWFAQDDSFDPGAQERKELYQRDDLSGDKLLDFFFVPEERNQRNPLYSHMVYAQDTPNLVSFSDNSYTIIAGEPVEPLVVYVTDIAVVASSSSNCDSDRPAGSGWEVVRSQSSEPQDFNQGAGGKYIWMFYKTGTSGPGITAVQFIMGGSAVAPAGWTKIDVDFNKGAGGEYIWLCYTKSENAKYIGRFQAGSGGSEAASREGFGPSAVVLPQDTNKGAGGRYIRLGYYYAT